MSTSKDKGVVKRFMRYVRIPSPSGGEAEFSAVIERELKDLGLKAKKDRGGNLFADVKGDDKRTGPILLNAHLDTVVHEGKIEPVLKNGIITSKGDTILGADNKAGVAVIMETLRILKQKRIKHPDIQVVFTVEEEIGLRGARKIERGRLYPRTGFVLDGGHLNVIHHRGPTQFNITAEIFGREAHAGVHPERGINAIKVASEAISKMKLGRIDPETTANIGSIEGGKATNIVPGRVLIKGEARSRDRSKAARQRKGMENEIRKACGKHRAKCVIRTERMYGPFSIKENDPVIRRAKEALKGIGLKAKLKPTGGGSDANIFNELGVRSVIIGVGSRHVHTSSEMVAARDLELSIDYLIGIIQADA